MKYLILLLLSLLVVMNNIHAQKQIIVIHYEKATSDTYSVGDKFTYTSITDSSLIKKEIIVRITSDSICFSKSSERHSNIHTVYKKELWKKRFVYWAIINTALLVPASTTVYGEMLLFAIPWLAANTYFASSGVYNLIRPKSKYNLHKDSGIIIVG